MAAIKTICVNVIFMAEWYSGIWRHHHLLNYYSIVGNFGCFLFFIIMSRVMRLLLEHKRESLLEGNLDDGIKKTKLSYNHLQENDLQSLRWKVPLWGRGFTQAWEQSPGSPRPLRSAFRSMEKMFPGLGPVWVCPRGSSIIRMVFIEHLLCAQFFFFWVVVPTLDLSPKLRNSCIVVPKVGFLDQQHQ